MDCNIFEGCASGAGASGMRCPAYCQSRASSTGSVVGLLMVVGKLSRVLLRVDAEEHDARCVCDDTRGGCQVHVEGGWPVANRICRPGRGCGIGGRSCGAGTACHICGGNGAARDDVPSICGEGLRARVTRVGVGIPEYARVLHASTCVMAGLLRSGSAKGRAWQVGDMMRHGQHLLL